MSPLHAASYPASADFWHQQPVCLAIQVDAEIEGRKFYEQAD